MSNPAGNDRGGRHGLAEAARTGLLAGEGDRAADVLQQLRVLLHAVRSHFQEVEQITGVGGAQVWALSVIQSQPDIGVGELARNLSIRQPTASIYVRNLVKHGLIQARRATSDRRAVQLMVLPAGEALLRLAPQPFTGVLPRALSALDAACLQRLHADLAQVVGQLGDHAGLRNTPLDRI